MRKPVVAFLTPFYNEFLQDERGHISRANRHLLPIEKSFDALAKDQGVGDVCIAKQFYEGNDIDFSWGRCKATCIDVGRNALVAGGETTLLSAKPVGDYTHYFFVDSDISFTPGNVKKIIDNNLPIVSGCYIERRFKENFCAGDTNPETQGIGGFIKRSAANTGLISVQWTGAGFLCIKRNVFEKIPFPWFHNYWHPCMVDEEKHMVPVYDDRSFSKKALENGFQIWLNTDVIVNHHLIQGVNFMSKAEAIKTKLCDLYINRDYHSAALQETERNIAILKNQLAGELKAEQSSAAEDTEVKESTNAAIG